MTWGVSWMPTLPWTPTRWVGGTEAGARGWVGGSGRAAAPGCGAQPQDPEPPSSPQPTNFTNPVYATLYMGGHGSRHSLASTDEKRELLGRGPEDEIGDPLA